MGIGRSNTPKAFVNACEIFVYTENLYPQPDFLAQWPEVDSSDWTETVSRAIEMAMQDDGWAFLGAVGNNLRQLDPAFDSRSYGHKQLSQLVRSRSAQFDIREEQTGRGPSIVYVRLKS